MRIHGICLVKNEGDIIEHFLRESLRWCDHIYVFDNGSTDGTWETVTRLATQHPGIVPYRQDGRPFDDSLRAEVFAAFRDQAAPGDWWCRLDADELYIDDPKHFLAALPRRFHVVWSLHFQYVLTEADLGRFTPEDEVRAPAIHAGNLPRYYRADASEPRFFRHRSRLEWPAGAWPRHLGLVAPQRIRVKHLQYRSPAQIQRRLDTRRAAAASGWQHFAHSLERHWREKIAVSANYTLDEPGRPLVVDERLLPRHLEPRLHRLAKAILHGIRVWP